MASAFFSLYLWLNSNTTHYNKYMGIECLVYNWVRRVLTAVLGHTMHSRIVPRYWYLEGYSSNQKYNMGEKRLDKTEISFDLRKFTYLF